MSRDELQHLVAPERLKALTTEMAKKQDALRRAGQRSAETEVRIRALTEALQLAPPGVRLALADELAEVRLHLLRLSGGSDKLLREVAQINERVDRLKTIRDWLARA